MNDVLKKYLFSLSSLFLISCQQVTLVIEDLPENTPPDSEIHIAGSFNYWDPGDPKFMMKQSQNDNYYFSLPRGTGEVEFLFTRGDWTTVEGDICGNTIENRQYTLDTSDTVRFKVESWMDLGPTHCPKVTLILEEIPADTPPDDNIYITGNFNSWNPKSENYAMKKNNYGQFYYTFEADSALEQIKFKFTRGAWDRVEVDENGLELPFRQFEYGYADTISIQIHNWSDRASENIDYVTFLVTDIPADTPPKDPIYIVGTFNDWYPRDKNYELIRSPNGDYFISLPQKSGFMEYKFTRGSWETVETNSVGRFLENRIYEYGSTDTVRVTIASWEDL